jgi:alpha-tubulin suppressor-like RCC1 family protein
MDHARKRRLSWSCLLVIAVAAMLASTPALADAEGGAAAAWGENWHGQLGAFFRSQREESPIPVEGLSDIRSVAAATSFNLALLGDGTVASWGGNIYGQLGNGGYKANWELSRSHVEVSGLTGVKAIAAANEHALALMLDGTVRAWGNNQSGQLGDGMGGFETVTGQNQRVPRVVEGLTHAVAIAAGGPSDYAVLENGTVAAWGNNSKGQLGIAWPERCRTRNTPGCAQYECPTEVGNVLCSKRPALVMSAAGRPLGEVVAISASAEAAYALLKSGEVVSWGSNMKGQLGQAGIETGPHNTFTPPGRVMRAGGQPLANVVEIVAGQNHALARLKNGEVVGWGNNSDGELGATGAAAEICQIHHPELHCVKSAQPIRLPAGHVEAISAGTQYSTALIDHKVYAWGRNEYGELGNGGTAASSTPTAVAGLGAVTSVSAAGTHVVALLASGVKPPPSPVTLSPKAGGLDLSWSAAGAARIVDRTFDRPATGEAEEEPEETEEAGTTPTGGDSGTLQNTTRPRIRGEARENQELTGTSGTWSGSEPTRYEYQWQRCRAAQCAQIPGATHPTYVPGPADVGYALQFVITAISGEARVSAVSPPSQTVKAEEEARRSKTNSSKVPAGARSASIVELYGLPLEQVPYEIKLTVGTKVRVMVGTPLPKPPGETTPQAPPPAKPTVSAPPCARGAAACRVTAPGAAPPAATPAPTRAPVLAPAPPPSSGRPVP